MTEQGSPIPGCTLTEGPADPPATIGATDGAMTIHLLGSPVENFVGEVLTGAGSTFLSNIPYTLNCNGTILDNTPKSGYQSWMCFPESPPLQRVSADGRSIQGTVTLPPNASGATTTFHWDLKAQSEP